MSLLITNIGELVTNAPRDEVSVASPGPYDTMAGAALALDQGLVAWAGPARQAPPCDQVIDAAGRTVLPGFVDSHAHLVFAGERSAEFAARMAGQPYTAGGIATTVAATRGVWLASHPGRELGAALPGEHQVRVRVDESG